MYLKWYNVDEKLPEPGVDVLALNFYDVASCEFGFRSDLDEDKHDWIDFGFPITHWAYCNPPEYEHEESKCFGVEELIDEIILLCAEGKGIVSVKDMKKMVLERAYNLKDMLTKA